VKINIVKGQHLNKKNGGTILTLEINVELTPEETQLLSTYGEIIVGNINFPKSDHPAVKIDKIEWPLSKFHISAHVQNGNTDVSEIIEFEQAVVRALTQKMSGLRALGNWRGSDTISE
jgi:hypothetical protein